MSGGAIPVKCHLCGVEGVAWEKETGCEGRCPAGADELKVALWGGAVDFVADYRMARVGEVDPDLMGAPGEGFGRDQCKLSLRPPDPREHAKPGLRARSPGVDSALQVDGRLSNLAEAEDRGIDFERVLHRPAGGDGEVGLGDFSLLHGEACESCGEGGFGYEHNPAGFAVETVDQRRLSSIGEFEAQKLAEPIKEGARTIRLGRVDEESGRLVDGEKIRGFPENFEVFLNRIHIAAMLEGTMIQLRNVTRTYSSGSGVVRALDGVSLDIADGEFLTISGPSGCGKSTLLNLLGGLDRPTSGELIVDGLRLHQADERMLTRYRRHTLGIVFQFFNLLPAMTVRENVELPLLLRGDPARDSLRRVEEMLDLVGLEGRARHFPHQLSGGEMQRAAIARALAGSPRLLLADEPTGNLDTANAARVCETFSKIASQKIAVLVIVTHSGPVAAMAPVRVQMLDGKILTHTHDNDPGR